MSSPEKRAVSPEKATLKAQRYCAFQERSQQEVRDKLYSWGLHRKDVESIISELIADGFLKEERFAVAYAGGKFRVKKWGRQKITQGLKTKQVSEPLIRHALSQINEAEYRKTLEQIIHDRLKALDDTNRFIKAQKAARYAISRGYESELVWDILRGTVGDE